MKKSEYMMISKAEFDRREGEVFMSEDQIQELIENSDTFALFLKKKIHEIQAQLATMQLVGQEAKAYTSIEAIGGLIDSLDKTQEAYKEFREKRAEAEQK